MDHVGIVDIGRSLRRALELSPGIDLHPWGYDWRLQLDRSSRELVEFLTTLQRTSALSEGSTVIAHSMGGLVALHALATAPDPSIFKGLVLVGTPLRDCVNILSPLRRGDRVLFNSDICSPEASFSFRYVQSTLTC